MRHDEMDVGGRRGRPVTRFSTSPGAFKSGAFELGKERPRLSFRSARRVQGKRGKERPRVPQDGRVKGRNDLDSHSGRMFRSSVTLFGLRES